jgi:hypothetical protein
VARHVGREVVGARLSHVVGERLSEGLVGNLELVLAASVEHDRALGVGGPGELGAQCRLAHTGFALEEDDASAISGGGRLQGDGQSGQFPGPSDETHGWCHVQAGGQGDLTAGAGRRLPDQLGRGHGLGQPFELEVTDGLERVRCPSTGHRPDQRGDEDLPTARVRAQTGRLHDRVAEVVTVLVGRLPTGDADADGEVLGGRPVVALDGLLHCYGAGEGGRRQRKHDHEPVAEVLHLGAAVGGNRGPQQLEMLVAQRFRLGHRQARRLLGRPHQVGEDHHHVNARHRGLPFRAPPG